MNDLEATAEEVLQLRHEDAYVLRLLGALADFRARSTNWKCPKLKESIEQTYRLADAMHRHHEECAAEMLKAIRAATPGGPAA